MRPSKPDPAVAGRLLSSTWLDPSAVSVRGWQSHIDLAARNRGFRICKYSVTKNPWAHPARALHCFSQMGGRR